MTIRKVAEKIEELVYADKHLSQADWQQITSPKIMGSFVDDYEYIQIGSLSDMIANNMVRCDAGMAKDIDDYLKKAKKDETKSIVISLGLIPAGGVIGLSVAAIFGIPLLLSAATGFFIGGVSTFGTSMYYQFLD